MIAALALLMRQWLLACVIIGVVVSLCHLSSLLDQLWSIAQMHPEMGLMQCTAIAPGVGVVLCRARRAASRCRMQAQVLATCKVGAAHSLVALASTLEFMASTDTSASASTYSCQLSNVAVAIVAAVAAVAIAAAGVGCVIFLKKLIVTDQTQDSTKEKLKPREEMPALWEL